MTENLFLDWAIKLLEQIETSEEKKLWCRRYSVYSRSPGQKTLARDLHDFVDRTYQAGLVIQNYHEVIQKWGLEERNIAIAPPGWLEMQPYLCVLACIAWHFRRDHFCEGSLISQSIAEGVLLRLFRRLKALCPTSVPAVTLQELCCNDCHSVPEVPGVYWVFAPEGMAIRFSEQEYRPKAKIYPAKKLQEKYEGCADQSILYIGKAEGKRGLRQRLRQYMDYGLGRGNIHAGGRAVWQISDCGLLLLAYEACENPGERAPIHWQTGGDERGKARNDLEKRGWHHIVIPTSFERSECRYDFQNPDRSTPRRTRAMPARIQGRKMTGSRSSPLWFS